MPAHLRARKVLGALVPARIYSSQMAQSGNLMACALERLLWRRTILFGGQWALCVIRKLPATSTFFISFLIYFLVCAIPLFLLLCFLRCPMLSHPCDTPSNLNSIDT
ncbi:hypothetical protein BDR03DRAFT_958465 [Suillus americanus]|nr:hypothetical protein BDR03DRAFT_958465 [Suillus americanus]